MREVNPLVGPEAWEEATPQLRKLVVRGAKLKPEIAELPFERLTHEQICAIATSASLLSWAASELAAMAPVRRDDVKLMPRGYKPFPKLFDLGA
jgi:hypothetical protein